MDEITTNKVTELAEYARPTAFSKVFTCWGAKEYISSLYTPLRITISIYLPQTLIIKSSENETKVP